jgi:hypothetical protein
MTTEKSNVPECAICGADVVPGERRSPREYGVVHDDCEPDIIRHECGQNLHTDLNELPWLTNAGDAEEGMTIVDIDGTEFKILGVHLHDKKLYVDYAPTERVGEFESQYEEHESREQLFSEFVESVAKTTTAEELNKDPTRVVV